MEKKFAHFRLFVTDSAAILLRIGLYEADSAAILLRILFYEAD